MNSGSGAGVGVAVVIWCYVTGFIVEKCCPQVGSDTTDCRCGRRPTEEEAKPSQVYILPGPPGASGRLSP